MFDWFFALDGVAQWETARNWLATVGGLVALMIGALTYRRNVRLKREEAARLVYATERRTLLYLVGAEFEIEIGRNDLFLNAGDDANVAYAVTGEKMSVRALVPIVRSTLIVHNASKERISPAYVHAFSISADRRISDSPPMENVDPESDATIDLVYPLPPEGVPKVGPSLVFRDSSGRWWRRHLSGPLRRARRVKAPSDRGIYFQHDPSVQHLAFKQGEVSHAVGVYKKNIVAPPSLWQRLRTRFRRSTGS